MTDDPDAIILERLREIARGRLLIRQKEACAALGISRERLVEEVMAGRLPWVKVGQQRRFKLGDLVIWIKRQEMGGWQQPAPAAKSAVTYIPPRGAAYEALFAQATGRGRKPSSRTQKRR